MIRVLLLALLVLLLFQPVLAMDLSPSHQTALHEVKAEKKVADAFLYDSNTLWVGMKSDGTKRDGFAQYLCLVLSDFGITKVDVVIKDYAKLMRKNEFVTMGMAYCP